MQSVFYLRIMDPIKLLIKMYTYMSRDLMIQINF